MSDLTLEREIVGALFEKHDDPWDRLAADGWLDLTDDPDVAAMVAGVAAVSGRELGVGPHLAAAATLGESARRLGVVTGVREVDGVLRGTLWSGPDPDAAVLRLPGGGLGLARAPRGTPTGLLPLRVAGVSDVLLDQVEEIEGDPAQHEARVAWLLAVEAFAAVADATARTLAYTRQREVFSAPLARLDVLRHRLVDMRTTELLGAALLRRAEREWADGAEPVSSWAALSLAGTRGVTAAEQAVQLHGGIGFTWELGLGRVVALAQRARLLDPGAGPDVLAAALVGRQPRLTDWARDFRFPAPPDEAPR